MYVCCLSQSSVVLYSSYSFAPELVVDNARRLSPSHYSVVCRYHLHLPLVHLYKLSIRVVAAALPYAALCERICHAELNVDYGVSHMMCTND